MPSLYFKGKSAVWNHHLSVPYHTLEKDKKSSLDGKDEDENLIIEGDNLLALKALLPKYQGRVKCIYIDPPYNTGNEGWVYNDNVNSPVIKQWLENGPVGRDDLTRHDKWLCMMTPRLKLLRELLSDDGVIFVSIDDNESHHLRNLMDEIFSENNFISQIAWRKTDNQANIGDMARVKEYVLLYSKNKTSFSLNKMTLTERAKKEYRYLDEKGKFRRAILLDKTRGKNSFEVKTPSGKTLSGHWMVKNEEFEEMKKNNQIYWTKGGDEQPYGKIYLSESEGQISNDWLGIEYGTNQQGALELEELFGKRVFDFPKPSSLIKHFINIATNKNDIILDSFAGSGTTAQAVMELNNDDEGNRKFIMIQLPETLTEKAQVKLAGYKFVHEITRDRTKKFISQEKIDSGFTYYKLGSSIDADSILSGKLPSYEEFAKYIFYLATGKNHPDEKKIKEKDYFVGKSGSESIYLLYENDFKKLKNLSVTLDWADQIHKKDSGRKLVYAPACFLDDENLEKFNMQFVSIPYNLFERK